MMGVVSFRWLLAAGEQRGLLRQTLPQAPQPCLFPGSAQPLGLPPHLHISIKRRGKEVAITVGWQSLLKATCRDTAGSSVQHCAGTGPPGPQHGGAVSSSSPPCGQAVTTSSSSSPSPSLSNDDGDHDHHQMIGEHHQMLVDNIMKVGASPSPLTPPVNACKGGWESGRAWGAGPGVVGRSRDEAQGQRTRDDSRKRAEMLVAGGSSVCLSRACSMSLRAPFLTSLLTASLLR
ncbi:hypothetical protein V8C86DRAFT_868117 [Haematococcus lacustris]